MEMGEYSTCQDHWHISKTSHDFLRCNRQPWDAVLSGSLVEIEIHIRATPPENQGSCSARFELSFIRIVDKDVFQS